MFRSSDWSCNQLRKKCDVRKVGRRAFHSNGFSFVNIDSVTQCLKCVEADSNRQNDIQRSVVRLPAEMTC